MKRIRYFLLILVPILAGWLAWHYTCSYFLRTGFKARYAGVAAQQPGAVIALSNGTHRKLTYWVTTESKTESGWPWPSVPFGTPLSTLGPEREILPGQSTNLVVARPLKNTPWRALILYKRADTMIDAVFRGTERLFEASNMDSLAGWLHSERQGYMVRTSEIPQ
jgi:hypothetical protein